MSDTTVDLVRTAFESSFAGDPDALARRLAHDAEWLGYPPSSPGGERRDEIVMTRATRRQRGLARHSRDAILATLAKRQRQKIVTEVVDVLDGPGDEVLLRWFGDRMQRFRVAGAVASIVVTVRAGEIVRMGDYMGYDRLLAVAG